MASAGNVAGRTTTEEMAGGSGPSPGELVLKKLFAQFVVTAEAKLKHVASQPLANPLSKYLQRGDDPNLDQLLASLKEVARFSLRSLLIVLFEWRKRLMKIIQGTTSWSVTTCDADSSPQTLSKKELEYHCERQQLAVEFIFCMTLTEILQQLPIHPVPEKFIHDIEELAFNHFKAQEPLKERSTNNPNVANAKRVADLYAEVIGVLSQVRFLSVRMRFFAELRNPQNSLSVIISVIEGLSFVRVKMYPVEELEGWFAFLQDCANYMIDTTRGEKVRHAMSALLVEILTPVAAVVKYEVSMPAFRKIVQTLYTHGYDHSKRHRHSSAYIPLVTVLLAISDDAFFLNNWHNFVIQVIFSNLKKSDTKLQWIALDSLYRLLWVYMIRIKGEGNVTTFARLRPIVDLLFPRSSGRGFQHKDFPPNIFVKIIYFIARQRVDYAMTDIVLDLVTKNRGGLNPERVIVGLRAFLMIADSLEKKEGDPPMPPSFSNTLSGSVTRTKTKFLTSTLTEQIAKKIGIASFYPQIRQALTGILRQLDLSVGRPLVSTNAQVARAPEDALSGERKPKLDLLKTCIAAIPRLLPDGMSKEELIEYLSRLTIHLDSELVKMAVTALLNILTNCPTWRADIVQGFSVFVMRDIPDSCPLVLEGSLKVLGQLLSHWRGLVTTGVQEEEPPYVAMATVEACALVTFCSYRSMTRRLSLAILKEVRSCLESLGANKDDSSSVHVRVLDVMEKATPDIIKSYLGTLTQKERVDLRVNQQNLTLGWLADRNACFLEHGGGRESLRDAWSQCIVGLLEPSVLPASCPLSIQLTWPFVLQRMMKAYSVIDTSFIIPERLDRPPQLRTPRGAFVSQPELFLWRNYLFFACCTAPPSSSPHPVPPTQGLYEAGMLLGDKHPRQFTARDLVRMIAPLVRTEGEIGEVVITALGLANPDAFGDLIEELHPWIQDALDLRKSDNVKKRRRRETERVHITRILALAGEHGCFCLCPSALSKEGEVCKQVLTFIGGIKLYLETESERTTDRMTTPNNDLRLHYAALISSIINSFPEGTSRARLLPRDLRHALFFMVAGWAGGFWHQSTDTQEQEHRVVKQLRSTTFISAVLHAMSALVCCGPIFDPEALIRGRYIYRWLENMLCSPEEKIQKLGQRTVQLLLEYNREPLLLNWVIDRCYTSNTCCASLCFHALSNTFARNPSYPCNMITVLHVILYYTASLEFRTRERALQLLHILDQRFFASGDRGSRRPEILGRITGSTFTHIHVAVSEELAFTNPELTLPLFSEMIHRFEEAPPPNRQCILQLMRPWLRNIELVEESPRPPSRMIAEHHALPPSLVATQSTGTNPVLSGSGWGSLEGTHLVLHNLLYLTTKYADVYSADVESLWSALSTWPFNIRVVLNYLARLSCLSGNLSSILKQAKRVMIYFSHTPHSRAIIYELMRELQCVDLITAEIMPSDVPPFYRISSRGSDSISRRDSAQSRPSRDIIDEAAWAANWRVEVRSNEGQATPLPAPTNMAFYASMKDALKLPCRQMQHMHRSNFALILLSEIVGDTVQFDWLTHLPIMLHVLTLGLDLHRPIINQHSKKLLCSLTVLLACRDDYRAACEARLTQHEAFLHSPSLLSLTSNELAGGGELQRCGSLNSLEGKDGIGQTNLARKARNLIKYISEKEVKRSWPFSDLFWSRDGRDLPSCDVIDLSTLVDQVLSVFQPCYNDSLKDKWAKTALLWATSCSSQQFASQSFQVCRALQVPLSTSMLREVLPRLAESASDTSDELRNYAIEIILSLENALNNSKDDILHPPVFLHEGHGRQTSDITPLPEDSIAVTVPRDTHLHLSLTTAPSFIRTLTPTYSLPVTSTRPPIPLAQSCKVSAPSSAVTLPPALEPPIEEPPPTPPSVPVSASSSPRPKFTHHRRTHSRGHSVTKVELPPDLAPPAPANNQPSNKPEEQDNAPPISHTHKALPERVHSPPAAGAAPSKRSHSVANPRLPISSSLDIELSDSSNQTGTSPIDALTSPAQRFVASAKEVVGRKSSAPPIRLMNLFEPLPGTVAAETAAASTGEDHSTRHTHPPRPHSEMITSSLNMTATAHKPTMSVVNSVPSIVTTKATPPVATPTQSDATPTRSDVTPTQLEDSVSSVQRDTTPIQQETTPTSLSVGKPVDESDEHVKESLDDSFVSSGHQGGGELANSYSADTSGSSVDSSNIVRVPSHPELRPMGIDKLSFVDSSPIMRARSVTQLQNEFDEQGEERHYKRRSYSGSRETVPGYNASLLTKEPHIRGSLDKLHGREKGTSVPPTQFVSLPAQLVTPPTPTPIAPPTTQIPLVQTMTAPPPVRLPLSHQNSPTKEGLRRRISADPERERVHSAPGSRARSRPRSMFETSSFHPAYLGGAADLNLAAASDLLSQLFWTSVSLMLSDYEGEFSLALRLFDNVTSRLDFKSEVTFIRLDVIKAKSKWDDFPGVLRVILKGLSLASTTHTTRRLISKLCPYVRYPVFDASGVTGLPLCIMALLPELILHFDSPLDELIITASNIAQACTVGIPQAQSPELSQVLSDMGHLFHLYSTREFSNTRTVWLKSVCHYISKGYVSATEDILKLMGALLEQGCEVFHQSVLWIVNEFLIKLEENGSVDMGLVTQTITRPVSQFIKGALWQEALGILSLIVKNSSSLVQPTTPHNPMVDLGFFQESLPGPTLQFSVDLANGSHDLRLAQDISPHSSWRRPHGCHRVTRDKLLNVINACGTLQNLYNSPSVIFTDDQALPKRTYSESEEEESDEESVESEEDLTSLRASSEILDSSQPESAVINTIGDTFNFLNQYSDEEEYEEEDMPIEGPFSTNKEQMYSSSLSSSQSSICDDDETQDHTHRDVSQEPPPTSLELPPDKHSRSASPFDAHKSHSPRPRSLERSLEEESIEATPPPRTEEYGVRFLEDTPIKSRPQEMESTPTILFDTGQSETAEATPIGTPPTYKDSTDENSPTSEETTPTSTKETTPSTDDITLTVMEATPTNDTMPTPTTEKTTPTVEEATPTETAAISEESTVTAPVVKEATPTLEESPPTTGDTEIREETDYEERPIAMVTDVAKETTPDVTETKLLLESSVSSTELEEREQQLISEREETARALKMESSGSSFEIIAGEEILIENTSIDTTATSTATINTTAAVSTATIDTAAAATGVIATSTTAIDPVIDTASTTDTAANTAAADTTVSTSDTTTATTVITIDTTATVTDATTVTAAITTDTADTVTNATATVSTTTTGEQQQQQWVEEEIEDETNNAESSHSLLEELSVEPHPLITSLEPHLSEPHPLAPPEPHLPEPHPSAPPEPHLIEPHPSAPPEPHLSEPHPSAPPELHPPEPHQPGPPLSEPHPSAPPEPHPSAPPEPHPPEPHSSHSQPSFDISDDDDDDLEETPLPPRVDLYRASHFICIADEEVAEVWQEHVSTLSRSRNPSLAVNTFYLFHRLFSVVRQQTCSLTQEAINYMGDNLWNISTHFLVTVELINSQLELPRIYLDTELLSRIKLLDPLVFFALEIQNNLEHFEAQRTTLLENISECKQAVILTYSSPPPSPSPHLTSFSPHQKSLTLCHSVHQIHFQLLLLVSSYIKLLHLLKDSISRQPVLINISTQLTDIHNQLLTVLGTHEQIGGVAAAASTQGLIISGQLDREIEEQVKAMKPEQAIRYLQDTVASNQPQLAIQLLTSMRSYFCDEQLFGIDSTDDLDVLIYGYAHCIAEGQEGVVGVTSLEHNVTETHAHLMTQNVSLLTLLEKEQLPNIETGTFP